MDASKQNLEKMDSINVIECDNKLEWNRYVEKSSDTTLYHLYGWKNVVENTYGHKSYYLMAVENGSVKGILPLFLIKSKFLGASLVSMPFLDYGGICADTDEIAQLLLNKAEEICNNEGVKYVDLRNKTTDNHGVSAESDKVTMILQLPDNSDELWKSFKPKVRNQVRKGEKSNLKVEFMGIDGVNLFYPVFARNMRDLGSPVHSKDLFLNMFKEFPEIVKVPVIFLDKTIVGGGILLLFKDEIMVPWASALRPYFSMCPNNVLYWEAMKYGVEKGCKRFDFGRSGVKSNTFKFKKQWGAKPEDLNWQYLLLDGNTPPKLSADNPKYSFVIDTWKKLPVSVANILGPKIRKYISA